MTSKFVMFKVQGTRTLRSDAPVVARLGDCGGDEGWKVPAKNLL